MTEASRVQKLLNEQNAEIDRLKARIEKLEAALRAEGITIPFPQRDLHVRTVAVVATPAEAPVPPPRRDDDAES